jgi:hypothetical protein
MPVDRRVDRASTTKPKLHRTYSVIDAHLQEIRLYPKTHRSLCVEITACSTTLFALAPARRRKVCMYPTVRVPRLCEGYPSSCVGLVGWTVASRRPGRSRAPLPDAGRASGSRYDIARACLDVNFSVAVVAPASDGEHSHIHAAARTTWIGEFVRGG